MLPLRAVRRRFLEMLSLRERRVGISFDPYNRSTREDLAEQLFETHDKDEPLGTIGRGRLLLKIIEEGFPTERLQTEYFRNLEHLLKDRQRREPAGQVLLGLGTGRSGSTSLATFLGTIDDSCCTHENPPLIFWKPEREQVQFHMRRLKLLTGYFSLVADVSHWWLNTLDSFVQYFPDGKVIGLIRDVDGCTRSFMNIRGYGWGSWNHWVPYGNGIWISHPWDPTYPTYPVPRYASINPDHAKYQMIARYIQEYNAQLAVFAASKPEQVMLVRTDELSGPAVQRRILDFVGRSGLIKEIKLNVHSVIDARADRFKF